MKNLTKSMLIWLLVSGLSLILFSLVGCNTVNTNPVNDEVLMKWVRFDHAGRLNEKCREVMGKPRSNSKGCVLVNLKKKTCTVYSMQPRSLDSEDVVTLGHETVHCFDGKYHK